MVTFNTYFTDTGYFFMAATSTKDPSTASAVRFSPKKSKWTTTVCAIFGGFIGNPKHKNLLKCVLEFSYYIRGESEQFNTN